MSERFQLDKGHIWPQFLLFNHLANVFEHTESCLLQDKRGCPGIESQVRADKRLIFT